MSDVLKAAIPTKVLVATVPVGPAANADIHKERRHRHSQQKIEPQKAVHV